MKKILVILIMLTALTTAVFTGDLGLAFEDFRFHSDFLAGFAPTYIRAGVDYSGLSLIKGQRTDIFVLAGGALMSADIWTDENGIPINAPGYPQVDITTAAFKDANAYSKWQGDLSLKLQQGFIHDAGKETPCLAAYAKYAFHWTAPHENWKDGVYSAFLSGTSAAYPDNQGTATNSVQLGAVWERLDKADTIHGFFADASVLWGPEWLLNNIRGRSDFMKLNLTAKGFYRLLDIKRSGRELTLIGIYLADRFQADYLYGSTIPQFYQEGADLGSKIRGYKRHTLGTALTLVNNFDVRVYGTEFFNNINPVAQLFLDTGYADGVYNNTAYNPGGQFFCTAGVELAVNVLGFAQVGYRFVFPITGENVQYPDVKSGLMFKYAF